MTHQDIPLPEAIELNSEFSWLEWDRAVQEQDSGFFKLQDFDQKPVNLSERSAFRAEVRA